MNREEVLKKIRENRDKIRSFGVKRIGVFGSFVRGEEKEDSDIDIIVEFEEEKKNFENFINLAFYLEELLGRKIDLLTPESISQYMKPYIEKEVVYESV
ncbi:MAG: nucleotidyltransferase [Deltaproteobacteria bacterium]|nr:MAG: nucleotidyltransferase [Deltaproteobacteria bacterium]